MPNWCFPMCCGPPSPPNFSLPLWRSSRGGSGASGHALPEPPAPDPSARWGDLARRVRTAVVLLAISLVCVFVGGFLFLLLVGAACVALSIEWTTLCQGRASLNFSAV